MIAGYLPFHFVTSAKHDPKMYSKLVLITVTSTSTFIAIFTSVFAGFKSATMYRDEIEDGTFLVMLSKPITRRKMLFAKWFALQTTIAIYALIIAVTFFITISAFDYGKNINNLHAYGTEPIASKAAIVSLLL